MRPPQSIIRSPFRSTLQLLIFGAALLLAGFVPNSLGQSSPQLVISTTNLRFGSVDVGHSEGQLISLTNTGQSSATISGVSVSSAVYSTSNMNLPLSLAAGQSVDVTVTFAPTSNGWVGGTIEFLSNASNPTVILQAGGLGVSEQAATASPSALSFGSVATGKNSTLPVVITNASSGSVTISALQMTGSDFTVTGPTLPLTLNAGQSVTISATFTPTADGEVGGSVFVYGPRLNIPMTGTGTTAAAGTLTVSPSPLNFGNVTVGTTATELISLSASGGSVTVYSATPGNSQFALDGATFPLTIAAGKSVSYDVAFAPQNTGLDSGTLSFASNASNPLVVESLSGTGLALQYAVNLTWNSTQDVTGYNVYRSTTSNGKYSKINSGLDANTAYTDNTVASGTYYYQATSVNSSGVESAPSTPPVQAVIP
jgi:hypothetical protein